MRPQPCFGYTLTELLLAMALGLLLIAGALRLYAETRRATLTNENLASLQERLQFALALLEDDIRLAGFWGLHADPGLLSSAGTIRIHCAGNDVSNWALQLDKPVVATNAAALPCPAFNSSLAGTDAIVVRHASPRPTAARAGTVQLQITQTSGRLFDDGSVIADGTERLHNLQVHAWYIDAQSSEHNLPALRRHTLVHGGLMQNQEIMPAIENLQVTLGIDKDDDGLADSYVLPGEAGDAAVLAVNLVLTARSPQQEPGFVTPDGYRRITATRTIALRNRPPT